MKIIPLTALLSLTASAMAFGGQEIISSGKDMKQTVSDETLFKDQEFQMGDYALYSLGNGPTHVGLFREHAWGEGGEINYFFMRYLGVGLEYSGSYGHESPDTNHGVTSDHTVDLDHVGGSLFFRWPIESMHLAPYAFIGGGSDFGDRKWGEVYGGVGVEYRFFQHWLPRFVPERMGLFADARWTYLGDRHFPDDDETRGDLNYFTVRAGFRFTY